MQETEKFENSGCCREQNGGQQPADCTRENIESGCAEKQDGQATCEREQGCGAAEYQQKIDQLTAQLNTLQAQYALVMADMQNFRQRVEKERVQWATYAQADVIKKLLPIIDNFDRGLQEAAKHAQGTGQDIAGFSMIYGALLKALTGLGVELMTDFTVFDPEKHEAVMQVESADHKPDDVVAVLENGYMFKGEVLRPAKVSVAK
jgi:molecular chaperone GrpE